MAENTEATKPIPEAEKKKVQSLHFYQLFLFAGKYEWVLMISGSLGAIVHSSSTPVFFLLFNEMVNGFGKNQLDLKTMTHEVSKDDAFCTPENQSEPLTTMGNNCIQDGSFCASQGQSQPSSAIGNHSIQGVTVYTPQDQSQLPLAVGNHSIQGVTVYTPQGQSQTPFIMGSNYIEGHGHGVYSSQSQPVSQSQPPFAMGRTSVHYVMYPTYDGSNMP
ncbi:ABC transporter B family member 19 [Camellia lanceoleosa]|uniref:ABC transporter B family member 19 n=1 Tax=Camellia lanceoleosa TaxID=1840588 RepID=A0ACC0IU41_9ERIC|nr:ABC transporter B family member 19 [Camellia lanceoleosa]